MPRPLLYMPKNDTGWTTYEITVRCIHSRYLLRPGKAENEQYIGCAVKALEMANLGGQDNIRFHLGGGLSNHFHLLISAKDANVLAQFKSHFFGNLSKEVGRLHKWPQTIFDRRSRTIAVASDAIEDRAMYQLAHGFKEGLTRRGCWPGVPWIKAVTEGVELAGVWIDRTGFYNARRAKKRKKSKAPKVRIANYRKKKVLKLAPLPGWEGLSETDRRARWVALVEAAHAKHRPKSGVPMGAKKILGTRPHDKPKTIKRSPAPLIHTRDRALRLAWKKKYRAFVEGYRAALHAMVNGAVDASDPRFAEGVTPFGLCQKLD